MFNFYIDADRDAHADTVKLFGEIAAEKYEAFTSTTVTDELENTIGPKREKMISLISEYKLLVLAPNDEAARLANIYVQEGIIPEKFRTDALHIAIATVNDLDIIISMNFKHIVKRKTKLATASINALNGYRAIEILTPMEVVENENA
jgi:DNA-binding transcriptional regulator YbjK